jgi:hypothetical protein
LPSHITWNSLNKMTNRKYIAQYHKKDTFECMSDEYIMRWKNNVYAMDWRWLFPKYERKELRIFRISWQRLPLDPQTMHGILWLCSLRKRIMSKIKTL